MTPEEMKAMEGTEFTYIFEDGDTIQAYVKKVSLKKQILSCWSFSLETDQKYILPRVNNDEVKEGACCLISTDKINTIKEVLKEIRDTKQLSLLNREIKGIIFPGCLF